MTSLSRGWHNGANREGRVAGGSEASGAGLLVKIPIIASVVDSVDTGDTKSDVSLEVPVWSVSVLQRNGYT